MIPLISNFFHDLLWAPERAVLWFRSLATFAATTAAQVVAYPPEMVAAWGPKDWAVRLGIAAVAGLALAAKAGDKNPASPP